MSRFSAAAAARRYNPYAGVFTSIGCYPNTGTQHFTPPGDNGSGVNDWVLLMQVG